MTAADAASWGDATSAAARARPTTPPPRMTASQCSAAGYTPCALSLAGAEELAGLSKLRTCCVVRVGRNVGRAAAECVDRREGDGREVAVGNGRAKGFDPRSDATVALLLAVVGGLIILLHEKARKKGRWAAVRRLTKRNAADSTRAHTCIRQAQSDLRKPSREAGIELRKFDSFTGSRYTPCPPLHRLSRAFRRRIRRCCARSRLRFQCTCKGPRR